MNWNGLYSVAIKDNQTHDPATFDLFIDNNTVIILQK